VKLQLSLRKAKKPHGEMEIQFHSFPNFTLYRKRVFSFTLRPLYPRCTNYIRGWVDPRAEQEAVKKRST